MKRILALLLLLALCGAAQGLSLTFQNPSDFAEFVSCTVTTSGSCGWSQSATGGNSYVTTTANARTGPTYTEALVYNIDSIPTTYASATLLSGGTRTLIRLYDGGMGTLYTYTTTGSVAGRYEVKMVGGAAKIYRNNVLIASSGALAQNPSHIGWGAHNLDAVSSTTNLWDNIVYGSDENKNIFSSPEQGYFIKKDLLNPASSGFAFPNGTIVSSTNMTTTWGFGDTNESRTVILQNFGTGQTYSSVVTSAGTMSGSTAWPIYDAIIASGAPQGYYVTTVLGTNEYSQPVAYRSSGASVTWNAASYSRGDSAAITYTTDALYWLPLQYSYRVDVLSPTLGVVSTHPITTQNGIVTTTFTESDPLGVYYAVLIATPLSGSTSDVWLGVGQTELTGYLVVTGDVKDAETQLPLSGAVVNISQGSIVYNYTTQALGNYSTNVAFYSGSPVNINITDGGYRQYTDTFTPLEAKTISLNFTLIPINPTFLGIAIGGVCRDSTYGRPISSCIVTASNTTYGESYQVVGNDVGYYKIDSSNTSITLTSGRPYLVYGRKSGYSNSIFYTVVTP